MHIVIKKVARDYWVIGLYKCIIKYYLNLNS